MKGKSTRWNLGLVLALTLGAALSARPVMAGPTIGMVADNDTNTINVFNADTDTYTVGIPIPTGSGKIVGDCQITADKHTGYVTNFNSQIFIIDLTQSPPALMTQVNPIKISNKGEDLSLSPRGANLLACDGDTPPPGGPQPVSVSLLQKRIEIGTLNLGSDCNSIDACQNLGSTNSPVIATSFKQNKTLQLNIDASGKLTNPGLTPLAGGKPRNANCAPQGKAGVVLHSSPFEIQSFTLPGPVGVDTRSDLTGGGVPISGAFNPAGTIFYVRNGTVVDAYTFNPTTGALGTANTGVPNFPITGLGTVTGHNGMDQIAVHPSGAKLYVSDPSVPGLSVYDTSTGALITNITNVNITEPTGVCLR